MRYEYGLKVNGQIVAKYLTPKEVTKLQNMHFKKQEYFTRLRCFTGE